MTPDEQHAPDRDDAGGRSPGRTDGGDGGLRFRDREGADEDTGLLSPVRAGTAVEAAVTDHAWIRAMLDAETALVRAQARLGTVPASAAAVIADTARTAHFDARALALASRETANPVVGLVAALARAVADRDPGAAEYVHRGSTSQDILDTAAMLVAHRALGPLLTDLDRTVTALAALAAAHRDTPLAGRTLGLHAVPTTFGLKAAGWRHALLDARDRLAALREEGLPVSLGGAAGTLAGYLEYARLANPATDPAAYAEALTDAFADETGLARPLLPWHALRTPLADLAAHLALTAGTLGKLALDVQQLSRTEVRELAEPGPEGRGGSSAMPHKRNPVLATLVRTAALQVPALAGVLTQCLLSEDERSAGAWHAEWLPLRECLRLTGGAAATAAELAEGLDVRPAAMRANLDLTGSRIVSERLAAVLAPHLGKAPAKALLAHCSRRAEETGQPLAEILAGEPALKELLTPDHLAALCDPAAYTGAAGPLVDRALTRTAKGPRPAARRDC